MLSFVRGFGMSSEPGNCAKLARKLKRRVSIGPRWPLLFLLLTSLPASVRADALAEAVRAYAAENYNRSARILMARAEQGMRVRKPISGSCTFVGKAYPRITRRRLTGFIAPRCPAYPRLSIFSA